ncbi:MAG: sulfatase-like hydrolase/transferase, partial [Draconibacterium sp.]|nr:sulfatase-like hydrolase/transferase [Draconibacterium sp.]
MNLFKRVFFLIIAVGLFAIFTGCNSGTNSVKKSIQKPNIIYILADDLGYGELGCFGQEKIETPNIDKLAGNGIKFTEHYSGAPVCAPSRCVLLTGKHMGHAQVRGNDEWGERGDVWNYKSMIADSTLEGQRPMKEGTITIGKKMQDAGYKTAMFGKWGLGAPQTHSIPTKMGFDFFVGYNCQRQAHTYYPVHLYKNEARLYLGNDTV